MCRHEQQDELESIERRAMRSPDFNAFEKTTIREIIRVYRGWVFVGRIVRVTLVALAGAAAFAVSVSKLLGWV